MWFIHVAFSHKSERSCIIIDTVVVIQESWLSRNCLYIGFNVAFRTSFSFLRTGRTEGKRSISKIVRCKNHRIVEKWRNENRIE